MERGEQSVVIVRFCCRVGDVVKDDVLFRCIPCLGGRRQGKNKYHRCSVNAVHM